MQAYAVVDAALVEERHYARSLIRPAVIVERSRVCDYAHRIAEVERRIGNVEEVAGHVAGSTRSVVAQTAPIKRKYFFRVGLIGRDAEPKFVVESRGNRLSFRHF